jgi:hypothetical protein
LRSSGDRPSPPPPGEVDDEGATSGVRSERALLGRAVEAKAPENSVLNGAISGECEREAGDGEVILQQKSEEKL